MASSDWALGAGRVPAPARTWQGHYLDGHTATRHPATVRLLREGLEVSTEGWTRLWPYVDLRQTQGFYEGEAVRLERRAEPPGPGETLVVADPAFLSSLHDVAPERSQRFHDPRRRGRRLALTLVAGVAIAGITAALYVWGIPVVSALLALRVPAAWEAAVGQSALDNIAPAPRRCEDPDARATLDRLMARLTAAGRPTAVPVHVYVVDDAVENAYALPGGAIVIFRPLLDRMGSPEELAGVLAHEYQHVAQRHALQRVIQHASTGFLLAAVTGDMTGPLVYGLEVARAMADLSYSRRAEEEADEEGLKQIIAARIDPRGTIAFQEKMLEARATGLPRYLSTHPAAPERVARLQALAERRPVAPEPVMSPDEWERVRRLCWGRPPASNP